MVDSNVCHVRHDTYGETGIICGKRAGKGPSKIVPHSLDQSGLLLLYRKRGRTGYAPFKGKKQ